MMVRLYRQEFRWSCFATCVRIILEYYGVKKTEKEIRILLKTTPTYGTLWEFVETEIKKISFEFVWKKFWNLEDLKALLNQSIPVIVGTKGKNDADKHAVVLLDISDQNVSVADPDYGEVAKISLPEFLKMWSERNSIAGYLKKILI